MNVCEHGQLKRSCPLCEKDEEIMTLEQALQWAAKNCLPEAVGRLRSREVVATLVDEIEALRQRLFEMQNAAIDLTKQLAACEKDRDDIHDDYQSIGRELHKKALELEACQKERDEYLTECHTLTRQNGEWQEKFAAIKAIAKQWKMPDIAERLRDSCRGGTGCKCTLQEAADLIAAIDAAMKGEK